MVKDFRHFVKQQHPKPGTFRVWGGFNVRIFNLLTQEGEQMHGGPEEPGL